MNDGLSYDNIPQLDEKTWTEYRKLSPVIGNIFYSQISPQWMKGIYMYLVAKQILDKSEVKNEWDKCFQRAKERAFELFRQIKLDPNEKLEETEEDFERTFAEYYRIFTPWVCDF